MNRFAAVFTVSLITLTGCGTRDYEAPPPVTPEGRPAETARPEPQSDYRGPLKPRVSRPGYVWVGLDWVGVPDSAIDTVKCALEDGPDVSRFEAFGSAILGGAVIGVVIRASGSWFFGRPVEPGPGHWFWNRLDQTFKTGGQGILRGALFTGVCQTLLAGGGVTPFRGLLGLDFTAVSAAISLATITSISASPFVHDLMKEDPSSAAPHAASSGGHSGPPKTAREAFTRLQEWTRTSDMGRALRYRVAPGLTIVGLGGGVGLVVFDWIQSGAEMDEPARAKGAYECRTAGAE